MLRDWHPGALPGADWRANTMTGIAAKDHVRWVSLAARPEFNLAALLRTKRTSATPSATPIQEWESEGGSMPEAGVLPAVVPG